MSIVKLANLAFNTSGSISISVGASNNLNITGANVIANTVRSTNVGIAANTFFDASNTAYYFSPEGSTRANTIQYNSIAMGLTRPAGDGTPGAAAIWAGDKVYIAASVSPASPFYNSGRSAATSTESVSLQSFIAFSNPLETTQPIDFGLHDYYAFALYANGNLYTWGRNDHGQCGLGTTTVTGVPTLAATNVTNVYHNNTNDQYQFYSKMIIKKSDGYLYSAGYNGYGQLGVGDTTNRSTFTLIPGSGGAISVWNMGGDYGTLVIQKQDYSIWACGYNAYAALGDGTSTNRSSLVDVTTNWGGGAGKTLVKVVGAYGYSDSAGYGYSMQGMLLDDGTNTYLKMAGTNSYGSLGIGNTTGTAVQPTAPALPSQRIADISVYGGITATVMCLMENGDLYTWGYNAAGQLGDGTTTTNGTPGLRTTGASQIFCDGHYGGAYPYRRTSFYKKNGLLYAAGYNNDGECGLGHITTPVTSFAQVLLPNDFDCTYIANFLTQAGGPGYLFFGSDGRMAACGWNAQNMISADNTNNARTPIEIRPPLGG
jgi:alpha-tubulin suppressor-like RCC1 family protein